METVDDVLSADPEIMSGSVVFRGTRVQVSALFEYIEAGDTLAEFLLDFPTVERSQVEAVVRIAGQDMVRLVAKTAA